MSKEASGSPPPEPFQPGPNFSIDPKEAEGLGLTNAEAMRHAWTGELPVDVEQLNTATFREQALMSRGPLRLSPEERAALAAYWDERAGRTPQTVEAPGPDVADALEPVPSMPDYESFKPWALAELQTVTSEVGRILDGDPAAVSPVRVLERVERWETAYHSARGEAQLDPGITAATDATWPLMDAILGRSDLSLDTRADLVDAMTHVHATWSRAYLTPRLVRDMRVNGPALTIKLFERENDMEEYSFTALQRALHDIRDPEIRKEISLQALMPLARKIGHARYFRDYYYATLDTAAEIIDESDKSLRQAEERGVRPGDAADTIVDGFNAQYQLGHSVPRHTELLKTLTTLERLYFPRHAEQQPLASNVKDFIEKVYQERVPGYESHFLMKRLAAPFNRLAAGCGSDLRIRR